MNKVIKVGSDFSGVGAFDYAIQRVAKSKGFDVNTVYACDWDKYARISYIAAHGEPKYYPKDVYEREIPEEPLDFYMTSPPCQAFSLAGKRLGKDDAKGRGILFFNSLEFIEKNQPRFFIFENVKGLLSDDGGRTFQEWVNLLGGKSVNGVPVLFPYDGAVDYHLYWQVLNTKEHGVPQNRERVFIIGIRDDQDNDFRFPKTEHLTKRLKDILEEEVIQKYFLSEKMLENLAEKENKIIDNDVPDNSATICSTYAKMDARDQQYVKVKSNLEKYYLSEKMISGFLAHNKRHIEEKNQEGFNWKPKDENDVANCLRANGALCATDNTLKVSKEVRTEESKKTRKKTGTNDFRGKEIEFREQDHMNALTTSLTNDHLIQIETPTCNCPNCTNQEYIVGTWRTHEDGKGFRQTEDNNCPTIPARAREDGSGQPVVMQINPSTESHNQQPYQQNRVYDSQGISPALNAGATWGGNAVTIPNDFRVRRLTPLECFRLQDFPDEHTAKCRAAGVSDSQLYKQAGNSITVRVLEKILMNLPL